MTCMTVLKRKQSDYYKEILFLLLIIYVYGNFPFGSAIQLT